MFETPELPSVSPKLSQSILSPLRELPSGQVPCISKQQGIPTCSFGILKLGAIESLLKGPLQFHIAQEKLDHKKYPLGWQFHKCGIPKKAAHFLDPAWCGISQAESHKPQTSWTSLNAPSF